MTTMIDVPYAPPDDNPANRKRPGQDKKPDVSHDPAPDHTPQPGREPRTEPEDDDQYKHPPIVDEPTIQASRMR